MILYRQVHKIHLDSSGAVRSGAFVPAPDHEGLLSTRHERVGAIRAYEDFLASGNSTEGSWAVTVNEVEENGVVVGIAAFLDDHVDGNPDGHVSIDFNPSPSKAATKRAARVLAQAATSRGRQYPHTPTQTTD